MELLYGDSIECQILLKPLQNDLLGNVVTNSECYWNDAIVSLETVFSFFDYGNDCTVLCNDLGNTLFIINVPYEVFKKVWNEYKQSIITFDGKN